MRRTLTLAALAAALVVFPATAGDAASAGGEDYHVIVTVPPGWHIDTDRKPVPRVLALSPRMKDFEKGSAHPMKRAPDQIVCGFSRAKKKDPIDQPQAQINAAVRQNFEDLKTQTANQRRQDTLLLTLIEDQGLVGVAVVLVGTDAENYGYLYASSTFDTPLYQYKGDCIGELSEGSVLKADIVTLIGSLRPVP
ncbi:MAG: hypothetical protein IT548_05395 [Alphaproteobacteria bacterium]|nr:hypothetical protein [Alphaproteobacteria bacterium]